MSRSYRKHSSWENHEYTNPNWGSVRMQIRARVKQAIEDTPDTDVMFPLRYRNGDSTKRRLYYSVTEIRDTYFTEIRNILNGYHHKHYNAVYWSYDISFLHCYNIIRGTMPDDGTGGRFDWLNNRRAKKIIRSWNGDPLDILRELTRRGIIQYALRLECNRRKRK